MTDSCIFAAEHIEVSVLLRDLQSCNCEPTNICKHHCIYTFKMTYVDALLIEATRIIVGVVMVAVHVAYRAIRAVLQG
jgi:hypothetical protein